MSWSEPSNSGPPVTGYDLQYRVGDSGAFTAGDTNVSGTSRTIDDLDENTTYEVQVLARNAEGDSDWSASGTGTTDANASPTFTSSATFSAAENQTAAGTVAATDGDAEDSVTGYTIAGGADPSRFSLDAATGELTFVAAPNYEAPTDADGDNEYEVEVRATSGTGAREKTADQTITVTVTDEAEAPGPPDAPGVSAAGPTSLTVSWSEPSNSGPPVTGYDLQYRVGDSGAFTAGDTNVSGTSRTIDDLDENTTYEVQVLARNAEGDSDWSASGTGTTDANASPTFTSSATFSAAENQTGAGTVAATDSDAEDSVTGYTIAGGADPSRFSLDAATGELTFVAAPNYEAPADADGDNEYEVEVRATSGTGAREKTADQTITVTVTDEAEAPGPPDAPGVSAAGPTSLTVSWSEPSNSGPPVTGYDLQYRVGDSGAFTAGDTNVSGTSRTIDDLDENTTYEVQVLARNAEGDSDWSASGTGTTDANASPTFTSSATFSAAENQTGAGTVTATDSDAADSVTGYAIAGGADAATFSIVAATGELTFVAAPNHEAPTDAGGDNEYEVEVRATSGTGAREKTADQTITVTVTDEAEAPGRARRASVSAAGPTSLTVSWSEPSNSGPPVTGYDLQYRVGDSGAFTAGDTNVSGTSRTIDDLDENTTYEVQVLARNDEGDSDWSASGTGTTDANASPTFTSSATFSAAENQTAAGTVAATDSDAEDSVTGYTIAGGADAVDVLDRRRDRGADVRGGAEPRGADGCRRGQRVRGGGAGDQRHGCAGEDGGPADHGDGDGRGGGAGPARARRGCRRLGRRV